MIRAEMVTVEAAGETLPSLIDRAARALTNARTSAEVLEAREMAGFAYDAAKRAARLSRAKGAHDALVAAAHRAQADALLIESNAKRRLADEYDAAQERGEVSVQGKVSDENLKPTLADIGLSKTEVFKARRLRDAEKNDPGITERALTEALDRGEEPTRAVINRAIGPSEYLNKRASDEAKAMKDKRDFRFFCKIWKAFSPECQSMCRDYIAKG